MSQRDDALEMLDRLVGCFHDRLGNPSPVDETKLAILRAAIDRAYPPDDDEDGDPVGEAPAKARLPRYIRVRVDGERCELCGSDSMPFDTEEPIDFTGWRDDEIREFCDGYVPLNFEVVDYPKPGSSTFPVRKRDSPREQPPRGEGWISV